MTFKYKFDTVKKVKKSLEKQAQKELSIVELQIENVRIEIEKLHNAKKALTLDLRERRSIKVSELQVRSHFEKLVEDRITGFEKELQTLEDRRKQRIDELIQRSKEHKIFESLEERHYEQFQTEQNRLEQIETDDIATKNFVRNNQ